LKCQPRNSPLPLMADLLFSRQLFPADHSQSGIILQINAYCQIQMQSATKITGVARQP
jgi:hypothetical protein